MSAEMVPGVARYTWPDLPDNCHTCLIYDDPSQRDAVTRAYVASGVTKGHAIRYFADETPGDDVRSWVEGLPGWRGEAQLKVIPAVDAYCPDGTFDPRRAVEALPQTYQRVRDGGFTGSRAVGQMTWALRGLSGSERLLEYEARLNTVVSDIPHVGMCQYDARRFDGATIFHVLRLHPYVVVGDHVVWNPYYVGTETALQEYGGA
jgi:hypothetical protein